MTLFGLATKGFPSGAEQEICRGTENILQLNILQLNVTLIQGKKTFGSHKC